MVLLIWLEKILDGFFALVPRQMPSLENINKTCLIAHRGAHNHRQGIIENTQQAFRLAKKIGCWGVELDIHATADGVFVVHHDATLKRLWQKDIAITQLTFQALRNLVPAIPSLAEVVAEHGGQMHLFIELKTSIADEDVLLRTLQNIVPDKDYHLLALDESILSSLSQFPKKSLLLVAVHNNVQKFCDQSISEQYGGVLGNYLLLTDKKMAQLKEAGQALGVGFIDSKNSLKRELNRGVCWIFTNQAVMVEGYLQQMVLNQNF